MKFVIGLLSCLKTCVMSQCYVLPHCKQHPGVAVWTWLFN